MHVIARMVYDSESMVGMSLLDDGRGVDGPRLFVAARALVTICFVQRENSGGAGFQRVVALTNPVQLYSRRGMS